MSAVPLRNSSLCVSKAKSISGESRALFCAIFIIPTNACGDNYLRVTCSAELEEEEEVARLPETDASRALGFCALWLLTRDRNAAPLLWWLIKQMTITWTKPQSNSTRSLTELNVDKIFHYAQNPSFARRNVLFPRHTICHKCVLWCIQLFTWLVVEWRVFPHHMNMKCSKYTL